MRPCLWDKRCDEYKNKIARDNAWTEICCILNPNFEQTEHGEKKKFEYAVTEKWRNIRDAFSKSLKKKTGEKHKKKYLYHEHLLFFRAIMEKAETEESFQSDADEDSETGQDGSQVHGNKGDENSQDVMPKPKPYKKRKAMDETEKAILKALKNTQTPSQKEVDEDESFFVSLLPSVRKLNVNDKLQFRVEDLSENESLIALERLMEEFFNPLTSNVRKHEIEIHLNWFKRLPQIWKFCVYFITHTSSQYVTMFALSILETVINQQWSSIEWTDKEVIKNVLHNNLIEKGGTTPHSFRNKYAKLLVDIAKHDWPERYPNFFVNILELLRPNCNQLIGLILLRTTSEEFMGIHANFGSGRKEEITSLLQQYIPVVFELLTNILENLSTKPRHTSTATPPPSPTHPTSTPNLSQELATATFRPDTKALNKEALDTVQHLFTWVPINQIPPIIIKAIFNFTNISTYAQDDDDMCVLAMSTINELLYRKGTPPNCQDFFVQLYHHTVELLRDVTNSSNYRMDTLDPGFVEKLSELFVLLIEQHLWRFEMEPSFSALEFLAPLFQLTMQLPTVQCYLHCLAVWATFIKQIKPQNAHKYSDVFFGLSAALLKKIQFTCNYNQLNQINDIDPDEDNETEWRVFLKTSIELIAMVAKYAPIDTFDQILIPWKMTYNIYRSVEQSVDQQSGTLNFEISETERLYYVLKDFSSLTQTLARLSSLFIDQENEDINKRAAPLINSLIEKLLESASLAILIRFYKLKLIGSRLMDCFVDIHSQLLAALKTWLIWMSQRDKMSNHNIQIMVNITLPVLLDGGTVPSTISNSAAHLLLQFVNIVFTPNFMVLPMVVQFIHVAPDLKFIDPQTKCIVSSSISSILLKPWGDLNHDLLTQRNTLIVIFFEKLSKDFRELSPHTNRDKALDVVDHILPSLSSIIEHCKNFPLASKKLLYIAIKPVMEHALFLFPSYVKYTEISNHILIFFINILGVLQQQLGVEGIKNAVQVFLQVAVSQQQVTNLAGLDKLLLILQLVVESPGNSYKTFLPGILQLCMENIYPLIVPQSIDAPDVFVALLTLLYSILLHRWQYFYISQVRLGYSPGCSESEVGPDQPQKPEQLLAVLQVFGQALLQQDINIFRCSLVALEDLNSKWRLYHKLLFRDRLLSQFLTVLLNCLIDKSQTLLSEDIQIAVYNMAAVNFGFFLTFLRQFIQNLEGLTPPQWDVLLSNFVHNHDKDMPTFVRHLQRFISEAQHFKMCNMNSPVN